MSKFNVVKLEHPEVTAMETGHNIDTTCLSEKQQQAYDKFVRGENLFITGPGGTGKTRLVKFFAEYAALTNKNVPVCAMTGCAALLLNCNAKTLHSWSGIRLCKGPRDKIIAGVLKNKNSMAIWKKAKILYNHIYNR